MAERVLESEGTFAFRCQTLNGRCKRIERCLAFRCSARWIRKIEEDTRVAATMKEEIDWRKELLASKKFNDKFSRNLLENGAKNYMQEIYMGYMYNRWRKISRNTLYSTCRLYGWFSSFNSLYQWRLNSARSGGRI